MLVHGASGAVGLAGCQLAAAHGMRVFGTASSEEGRALGKQSGAVMFNHHEKAYAKSIMVIIHYFQVYFVEDDGEFRLLYRQKLAARVWT